VHVPGDDQPVLNYYAPHRGRRNPRKVWNYQRAWWFFFWLNVVAWSIAGLLALGTLVNW
jgi:hypothetical protein